MREFEQLAVECKVQEDELRMAKHVAGFNDDLQNIIKVHAGLDYKDKIWHCHLMAVLL